MYGESISFLLVFTRPYIVYGGEYLFSHAFHSSMMDDMLSDYEAVLSEVSLNPPQKRFVSNVTGETAGDEVTELSYWLKQVREAVRFSEGVQHIQQDERLSDSVVWLEVGPGRVLGSLVRKHGRHVNHAIVNCIRHGQQDADDSAVLLAALGECWLRGIDIDWDKVRKPARRVPLPTYPFERQRYWVNDGTC